MMLVFFVLSLEKFIFNMVHARALLYVYIGGLLCM